LKDLRRCLSRDLIYDKLKGLDLHQIVYFYLLSKGKVKRNLGIYIFEISKIKLEINGEDVKALGVEEGPKIRELLEEVMRAKVRGEVGDRDSQINYLRKLVRG
jgi:tRNA nucleotidyltransferase (CCA-adding enzyme)